MPKSFVKYNGFTFPDRSNIRVNSNFVYDGAGRTVIGTRYVLTVSTIITDDAATLADLKTSGTIIADLRKKLSLPGKTLEIHHDGFAVGPLQINLGQSTPRDIEWGPKPRVLSWVPIGDTMSCEVVWECEFMLKECESGGHDGVKEFNYSVAFSMDSMGFTVRRISGFISIANTRVDGGSNDNTIVHNIDTYRDFVVIEKPANFMRTTADWEVAEDRSSARFTIVDAEIRTSNVYPQDVVSIRGTHRVAWNRQSSISKIYNTISLTIELLPGVPKVRAWMIFRAIVTQRMAKASNDPTMILNIDISEDLYGFSYSFSITWTLLKQEDIANLILNTGLFTRLDTGFALPWEAWSTSMLPITPFIGSGNDRGLAQAEYPTEADRIVDLCNQEKPILQNATQVLSYNELFEPILCNPKPRPNRSYLNYEIQAQYYEASPAFVHVELGQKELQHQDFDPDKETEDFAPENRSVKRFLEEKAGSQEIIIIGYAERVGYKIPRPGKIKIGDATLEPVGSGYYVGRLKGTYYCQPVYSAAWKQKYRLVKPAESVDHKEQVDKINGQGLSP